MSATSDALFRRIPETGCSADYLMQLTGSPPNVIEELLHQLVAAGRCKRKDNRYIPWKPTETAEATLQAVEAAPATTQEDDPMPATKTCARCLEKKTLDHFRNHKSGSYGKASTCIECAEEAARKPEKPAKGKPKAVARAVQQATKEQEKTLAEVVSRHAPTPSLAPLSGALAALQAHREKLRADLEKTEAAIATIQDLAA